MNNVTLTIFRALFATGAVCIFALAVLFFIQNVERLKKFESLPRNKVWGMLLAFPALFWCIPHAQVVAPNFLLPFLVPIAIIVPILSYFYLDYLFARSLAGLIILFSYEIVHLTFQFHTPFSGFYAILGWLFAIAGIFLAGYPYLLRDALRKSATNPKVKYSISTLLLFLSIMIALAVFITPSV
jgi:hypothetical protein